jgi:hypothetical protein
MCQRRCRRFLARKAELSESLAQIVAAIPCNLRNGEPAKMQNATGVQRRAGSRFRKVAVLLGWWLAAGLMLTERPAAALTLAELRADPNLTPERFMKYFANFKFEMGRTVRKPEVFLETQSGDCDDFATLAADLLRQKGYTTRLVAVFLPEEVHVVCYVAETNSYLDYNCRKNSSPLVKCDADLAAIGASVAQSFRTQWRSVSEFTFQDGLKEYLLTEFH